MNGMMLSPTTTADASVARRLRRKTRSGRAPSGPTILAGALGRIGLPAVLTILEMERATGIFFVRRAGESGRFFIRAGQIVQAFLDGQTPATGAEAVYAMLGWHTGSFELRAAAVDAD